VATDASTEPHPHRGLFVALGLCLLTITAFIHVLANGFVNYDDPVYVTANEHIKEKFHSANLRWALTATEALNWHPLTWMSLQLDHRLFGMRAWGYHLTSLLLHIANTVLLFAVLRRMTGTLWRSALVAALFAVHPLHVESVVWVAERKEVLSGLFWMLTLWLYVSYVRSPSLFSYVLVALGLGLGLMAKPMVVTLPCVLLLLDYWPMCRPATNEYSVLSTQYSVLGTWPAKARAPFTALLLEKAPLFLLVALECIATWYAQSNGGEIRSLDEFPLGTRISNALVSYVRYLGMMIWPNGLAPYYPHPGDTLPLWQVLGSAALLAGITALAIVYARRLPYLLVGWFWYLGTLVPVIGLVQVGEQALADRYTYLPLIGVFLAAAWGLGDLVARWQPSRELVTLGAIAALAGWFVCSWMQVRTWHDSRALWEHALRVTPDNPIARNNLALAVLEERGNPAEAEAHLRAALRMKPGYGRAYINLGTALDKQGKIKEAIVAYRQALAIQPDLAVTRYNLGIALAIDGQTDEAIEQLREAVRLGHGDAQAKLERALATKRNATQ
jgi:tetratricopeptide (TPR) repeat protein